MGRTIRINNRTVGPGHPVYIIAEMSANHNHDFDDAVRILRAAKEAGADAVKMQTYTPDTLTIDCKNEYFIIKDTIWEGKTLYELYGEAFTPWEWQPRLKEIADSLKLDLFSSAFDYSAIEFLEAMDVPAHKIASFELVDIPLIRKMAATGKPIIMSTGMATIDEIEDAVEAVSESGTSEIALLKCTSAYPALPDEMNLNTIPDMVYRFGLPVGLSDHTLGIEVPVAAVTLGACIIEKHFTLSRDIPGPDSVFSLEPNEFRQMVSAVRNIEKALGSIRYEPEEIESRSRVFRRSLFVIKDMAAGEVFTADTFRSIRPGYGLPPKYLKEILGHRAVRNIKKGTPLRWDLIENIQISDRERGYS